jgi:hypothetical protein
MHRKKALALRDIWSRELAGLHSPLLVRDPFLPVLWSSWTHGMLSLVIPMVDMGWAGGKD